MTTGHDAANTVAIYNKGREVGKTQGRDEERAAIIAFLRKRTQLKQLADLLAAGVHLLTESTQNEYVARQKISLIGPLWPTKKGK